MYVWYDNPAKMQIFLTKNGTVVLIGGPADTEIVPSYWMVAPSYWMVA